MGRSLQPTLHYKIEGGQPYDSFTSYVLRTHKKQSLYIGVTIFDQNLGSKPQNFPWGSRTQQKGEELLIIVRYIYMDTLGIP